MWFASHDIGLKIISIEGGGGGNPRENIPGRFGFS
jgi:hypothetical protein